MGHSGGTFIGIQAAAQAPHLYHAYIGVAQMSNQLESERLAYEYMLQRFKEEGDGKMVRRLEKAPVTDSLPLPGAYRSVRDVAMHRLGVGTTHDMRSIVSGLLLRVSSRTVNTRSGRGSDCGVARSSPAAALWNTQLATDLTKKVTRLELPVYFFHGVYDYTVSYPLAKSYYEQLDAPLKGFYTFSTPPTAPCSRSRRRCAPSCSRTC